MFAAAIKEVQNYTLPVVISMRTYSGEVGSAIATYIVLNDEGWILTAAHVIQSLAKFNQDREILSRLSIEKDKIEKNAKLTNKQKKKALRKVKPAKDLITDHSIWWGKDNIKIDTYEIDQFADLAIGQMDNFNPSEISKYPYFADINTPLDPGTSLCRLGFPFHTIRSTFDENENKFELEPGSIPAPRFPLDGIFTRNLQMNFVDENTDNKRSVKFIETSTPGLKGQSGGPVFDIGGTIFGIQSRTFHFELGFSPPVRSGHRNHREHQFLNVGIAISREEIFYLLDTHKVKYNTR